jgi:hypothetical protein
VLSLIGDEGSCAIYMCIGVYQFPLFPTLSRQHQSQTKAQSALLIPVASFRGQRAITALNGHTNQHEILIFTAIFSASKTLHVSCKIHRTCQDQVITKPAVITEQYSSLQYDAGPSENKNKTRTIKKLLGTMHAAAAAA